MDQLVPFASTAYWVLLLPLVLSRIIDFVSTWVATPTLLLEANPVVRKLGWQAAIALNLAMCVGMAFWPMIAIAITTMSLLVAARNFQTAWLMRSLGEENYRDWYVARVQETRVVLYLFCLAGHTLPIAAIGATLMIFSGTLIPFSIGFGIVIYCFAVISYILHARWRLRRNAGKRPLNPKPGGPETFACEDRDHSP